MKRAFLILVVLASARTAEAGRWYGEDDCDYYLWDIALSLRIIALNTLPAYDPPPVIYRQWRDTSKDLWPSPAEQRRIKNLALRERNRERLRARTPAKRIEPITPLEPLE